MPQDAKKGCGHYGLTYVETSELALRRRRCGKGFTYLDGSGNTVRDNALKVRIRQIAIPPAWTDVCIAADDRAHIQAIGRDAEGRLQYLYHPDWERYRATTKEQRLLQLGSALPRVRGAVKRALAARGLTRTKAIAAVARLIDRALLRPGYEEYARKAGGRGAATLLKSDVEVEGDTVLLEFKGKGGKEIRQEVRDPLLARVLRKLSTSPGRRLFSAPDGNGGERPITAREVNQFLAEASGVSVSAKDFRTFRATATALAFLSDRDGDTNERLRKKAIGEAADEASKILGNTRTVARSSYIHPGVIAAYEAGRLRAGAFSSRMRSGLTKIESALMHFLEKNPDIARR
jgi:DNA topoisomerase-1